MCLEEVGWGDKVWVYLERGRDRWRAVVSVVMNSWFHKMQGIA